MIVAEGGHLRRIGADRDIDVRAVADYLAPVR
ncbi:hypothetical protein IW245_002437 [Longispora fulva]|uniref:Uncharacterized protein n=1 Tax=Longispora fulva TaxID=619741 RepID=A0A8J7GQI2_9ACTN|nr:hypothetical protein [Longispora fulva]